jgi:hypothetical protein
MKSQFEEGQTVAVRDDYPELDLKAGDVGVIWVFYDITPPAYEVTFCTRGEKFDMTMQEEELTSATTGAVSDCPRAEH